MFYFAIGVVVGTFIPMPQQQIVRDLVSGAWKWVKSTASNLT